MSAYSSEWNRTYSERISRCDSTLNV